LKSAGKQELRDHGAAARQHKAKKKAAVANSLKGLTKKDIVEEAELDYLSSLTGKNLRGPS
jgi:hypothetical protein